MELQHYCVYREKNYSVYIYVMNWVYINEYLYLQNLKLPYSNPSTQNKSSKSTISLIFLMITKSGYCCVKYLSRCIFWYLIYKEFKSPNLKSSVVKEFVIRAKCVNHWTMEEYDWYRPGGYLGKKSWQVFFYHKENNFLHEGLTIITVPDFS